MHSSVYTKQSLFVFLCEYTKLQVSPMDVTQVFIHNGQKIKNYKCTMAQHMFLMQAFIKTSSSEMGLGGPNYPIFVKAVVGAVFSSTFLICLLLNDNSLAWIYPNIILTQLAQFFLKVFLWVLIDKV